jgi:Tfp pilus assembly protein PilV
VSGFTLLEVVVALFLIEVAVMGAVGTLTVASRTLGEAERLERTVMEAEGVLDSLAGVADPEAGTRPVPGGTIEWTIDATGTVLLHAVETDGAVRLEVTSATRAP